MQEPGEVAAKLLGTPYETLDERTKKVARHIAARTHIARNVTEDIEGRTTFGQRTADAVTTFGGSWFFVGLFGLAMLFWVGLNGFLLVSRGRTFDPYPYILLNLFLSMIAAIQAPIILMSQNRQSDKDRIHAEHGFEVSLKSELEIMLLHQKVDHLGEEQWVELLNLQKEQLKLLTAVIKKGNLLP